MRGVVLLTTGEECQGCRLTRRCMDAAGIPYRDIDLTDPANARFFRAGKAGHAWFDLEGYVAARLHAAGVGTVAMLGEDTYSQPDRFYSFRRATHRGEPDYGREISLIALR